MNEYLMIPNECVVRCSRVRGLLMRRFDICRTAEMKYAVSRILTAYEELQPRDRGLRLAENMLKIRSR